jgi:hypothetical protein
MTIQLKIVIFYEKRPLLNVEKNQPMASLCYFYLADFPQHLMIVFFHKKWQFLVELL